MGGEFTLTEREAEYLFRIIDSSINIFRRHQFFLWAQGELQGLLPHGMLICLFDEGNGQAVNIERFSRTDMDEIRFSELCRPDGGIVFRAMSAWSAGKNQPLLVCPNNSHTPTYKRFFSRSQTRKSAAYRGAWDVRRQWPDHLLLYLYPDFRGVERASCLFPRVVDAAHAYGAGAYAVS